MRRWLALAGVALGLAFLAKMLEGVMVAPALAAAYLVAAPVPLRTRLLHLLGAAAGFVVAAGWFVVLTMLWPASSRPYIAGSTDNNFMNLVLGYNGFARVLGHNHHGFKPPTAQVGTLAGAQVHVATGRGPAVASAASATRSQGMTRLFSGEFGFEIGWLVPAAVLAIVLVVVARGRAPRTDPVRRGRHPVRRLDPGRRSGAELHAGHDPRVLQPVHRARRRGDVRDRRQPDVGATRIMVVPNRSRGDTADDGAVELVDARGQRATGCPD